MLLPWLPGVDRAGANRKLTGGGCRCALGAPAQTSFAIGRCRRGTLRGAIQTGLRHKGLRLGISTARHSINAVGEPRKILQGIAPMTFLAH